MTSVTVLCPNARRCLIKVTPGTLLREVLEEACLKQGYDADIHELSHQKRKIELSLPFRLSGLANNVTLELVPLKRETATSAEIALQLDDGTRKILKFDVTTSLFGVLERFSEEFGQNLTDSLNNHIPSCAFMNKQYRGEVELQNVSLRIMGIRSGRSLIRYQRVKMTDEEISVIVDRVEKEKQRKLELDSAFERRRAENVERDRIERERMERFDAEQRSLKEKAREQERNTEAMDAETPSLNNALSVFARDRIPSPTPANPNDWSFDRPTFIAPQLASSAVTPTNARLQRLQNMLQNVDNSLSGGGGNVNQLVEQLAEQGRIPVGRLCESMQSQEEQFPLRNFKFPDVCTMSSTSAEDAGPSKNENLPPMEEADRKTVIFEKRLPTLSTSHQENEVEESFFDVNVEDIKNMQKSLTEEVRRQQQKALVPKSYAHQRNKELKMSAYKHTVIRIVLGDRRVLQALFYTREPSSHLVSFFSSLLCDPSRKFDLNLVLNCPIEISGTKNLVDVGIAPASTLYVKFRKPVENYAALFLTGTISEVSNERADSISKEWLSANSVYIPWSGVIGDEAHTAANKRNTENYVRRGENPPGQEALKMPKWLKK